MQPNSSLGETVFDWVWRVGEFFFWYWKEREIPKVTPTPPSWVTKSGWLEVVGVSSPKIGAGTQILAFPKSSKPSWLLSFFPALFLAFQDIFGCNHLTYNAYSGVGSCRPLSSDCNGHVFSQFQSFEARRLFMHILWLCEGFWRSLLLLTAFVECVWSLEFLEGKLDWCRKRTF